MSEASTPPRYFIGTITGTSVDGLDLALIEVGARIRFVDAETRPLPDALRGLLLALGQPGADDLDRIGSADAALGGFIGSAINSFLVDRQLTAADIRAIGSHGQTIRHRPDAEHPFTWQIGDPNRIAELTGITTVADFRRRDMAAGGQGAPLVPIFHECLFRSPDECRVIVNIGGISNLTVLPAGPEAPIGGFDTGPGNALLDAWCGRHQGRSFDENGRWAGSGNLLQPLLDTLLADAFLSRSPPKSTGREVFNLPWLEPHLPAEADPADVQRTLAEYTARTITDAVRRWSADAARLIVCGGGRLNSLLMTRLQALSPVPVETSEAHGYDGDAMEAAAFAWLAHRRLTGEPGNAQKVTGAEGPRVLGAVYPGRSGTPD